MNSKEDELRVLLAEVDSRKVETTHLEKEESQLKSELRTQKSELKKSERIISKLEKSLTNAKAISGFLEEFLLNSNLSLVVLWFCFLAEVRSKFDALQAQLIETVEKETLVILPPPFVG